jgi:hypothetical protein
MTAEEFAREYAERSELPLEYFLERGWCVVPCMCDYANCKGMRWTTKEEVELRDRLGQPFDVLYPAVG